MQVRARDVLRRLTHSSSGMTLVEVLVAVGILSVILGLFGTTLFQVLSIQRTWRADIIATREVRQTFSWFSRDAFNAEAANLTDGGPPIGNVTLQWNEADGTPHTVSYSVSGDDKLIRDFDGASKVLASGVVSAGFSLAGQVLTFDLEVEAARGQTLASGLQSHLRALQ